MCDFFGFVSILFKLTLTCEKSKSQRKMEIKRKRFEDVRKLFDKIGFEAIKTLGKGGYGEVFLAKNSIDLNYFRINWSFKCHQSNESLKEKTLHGKVYDPGSVNNEKTQSSEYSQIYSISGK